MQFSEKSKQIIDSCRFCWMCRHICPIGNATGKECNTSRGRALTLSLVTRNAAELAGDIVDNVYECSLCEGCTNDCATGWDPVKFTKEARTIAALDGNMPTYIDKLVGNIEESGNIYGIREIPDCLKKSISDIADKKADVLFFIGRNAAYKTAEKVCVAVDLLKAAKVDFTVDKNEPSSGCDLDFLIGAADETVKAMRKCAEKINTLGVSTVVCYDPADAKVFLREYKEYGIELDAKVVTFTAFLADLVKNGKLKLKKSNKVYTFNDPALLARALDDTTSAREVLTACGDTKEMLLFGKLTMLAGNLIMNEYLPLVMKNVALNRFENAKGADAKIVVTASPDDYFMLSSVNDGSLEIKTIEEVVVSCL